MFDLPNARIWKPDPEIDLGFEFLGRRCATPIGPAAGPHSQLAENIVLAWLGGSRLFELKTVQILDDLVINRPCIDMQTIGYNIEWSQELTVPQSLTEYVKASMLIDILRRWEPLADFIGPDPGPHVFDMSVGYDLAGISSPKVAAFIDGMRDATAEIERLRAEIGGPFAEFADLEFDPHVSDTLTLSTFHGCPPDEIESITKHLIDDHDLDVIVKLNPTLLGYETVARIVNDDLGYADVTVKESAFADDLSVRPWHRTDRGTQRLRQGSRPPVRHQAHQHPGGREHEGLDARRHHVPLGTPAARAGHDPARPSLDRPPRSVRHPRVDDGDTTSWSASRPASPRTISPSRIATGVNPATVCSDLLKPGGYGRLAPMLKALTAELASVGPHGARRPWKAMKQAEAEEAGYPSVAARHVAHVLGEGIETYHHRRQRKAAPSRRSRPRDVRLRCLQFLRDGLPERCVLQHQEPRLDGQAGSSTSCSPSCATSAATA